MQVQNGHGLQFVLWLQLVMILELELFWQVLNL